MKPHSDTTLLPPPVAATRWPITLNMLKTCICATEAIESEGLTPNASSAFLYVSPERVYRAVIIVLKTPDAPDERSLT